MSSRDCVKEHKETAKHVEGYKPTAASHGVDRSMVAQGNHKGSGYAVFFSLARSCLRRAVYRQFRHLHTTQRSAPKGDDKIGTHLASEETAALDDERGSN